VPVDDARWAGYLNALPTERRDIHFSPELYRAYSVLGLKTGLAVTELMGEFICQPLLLTDNTLRNAYNFGGPVASSDVLNIKYEHQLNVESWKTNNACGESTILNPFLASHQLDLYPTEKPAYVKDVVWVDLTKPMEWRGTSRRAATKAMESGVTVKQVDNKTLPVFHKIYTQTMLRRNASNHWMFPLEFFEVLCAQLDKRVVLLYAYVDGWLESACLLLLGPEVAYYHFACTNGNHPKLGVNNLLVAEAAAHARKRGCTKMCLGGGLTDSQNDSLFKFKAGFSSLRAPVYKYITRSALERAA
jgi:hypothetical protein